MSENRVSVLGELFITQYGHAAIGYGAGTINDAQYGKAHESLFRYVRNLEKAINNTRPIEDALNERIAELETERDQAKNELADIRKMVTVSKNYSELWEEREWLSNKLTYAERCIDEGNARIAKIIAERDEVRAIVEKLIKVGNKLGKFTLILDSLSANGFVDDWIALVDEWKESEK
jgi:hypothetical protein